MTTIKTQKQYRDLTIEVTDTGEERIFSAVMATEYPAVRTDYDSNGKAIRSYIEVLDISSPEGVDRVRIDKGGIALCDNHNITKVLGKVRKVWIDGDKLLGESYVSRAEEGVWTKIKEGVYNQGSLGYIQKYRRQVGKDEKTGLPIMRVGIIPTEFSVAGVPLDPNALVTNVRSMNMAEEFETLVIEDTEVKHESVAETEVKEPEAQGEIKPEATTQIVEEENQEVVVEPEVEQRGLEVKEPSSIEVLTSAEQVPSHEAQVAAIRMIGQRFGDTATAERFIEAGRSAEELLTELTTRGKKQMDNIEQKDLARFSMGRAVKATMTGRVQDADFEIGLSKDMGYGDSQICIPFKAIYGRSLTQGNPAEAGVLVEEVLRGDLFSPLAQDNPLIVNAGVKVIPGISGILNIPRQTAKPAATSKAENASLDESNSAYDMISLINHRVGVYSRISSSLKTMNSIVTEAVVAADIRKAINEEIDRQCFYGSGLGTDCKGLFNQAGLQVVSLGTDGAPLDWEAVVALETAIESNNYHGSKYLMNSKVYGALKTTRKDAGSGQFLMAGNRELNGYQAVISNVLKSNLSKGAGRNLSPLVFGDFSEAILGLYGQGMVLQVNPYSEDREGFTRIVGSVEMDFAVRRPEAIAVILDAVA